MLERTGSVERDRARRATRSRRNHTRVPTAYDLLPAQAMKCINALALVATVGLSGCVLYSHPAHGRAVAREAPPREECRPSQHWEDGHCVHNGRGRGARKHDD
jgi:hypothetical protein